MQMKFFIPKINVSESKRRVEEMVEQYKLYQFQATLNSMPAITASYSLAPAGFTGKTSSSTEDTAIRNLVYAEERERFMTWFDAAVKRLPLLEQSIIQKYFLEEEYDFNIYHELHLSERHYYRKKTRAINLFATALGIVAYEGGEVI